MKIESDRATVWGGIRHGRTLGSPVALLIENRDHANWADRMNPWPVEADDRRGAPAAARARGPRGLLKYGTTDVRNVLERASARETAARVAAGALAKVLPARARRERPQPRASDRLGAGARARHRWRRRTSRASTTRPFAASTRRPGRRWWPRSTAPARRTRASAGYSRCARSASLPGSASHVSWDTRIDARHRAGDDVDPRHEGRRDRRRLRRSRGARRLAGSRRDLLERASTATCARRTAPAASRAA